MSSIRRVFLLILFLGDVELQAIGSKSNFGYRGGLCGIGVFRYVVQVLQNLFKGIHNPSRSSRLRIRLPDFYRMSKVGVYPSIVPSFFSGDVKFEAARS